MASPSALFRMILAAGMLAGVAPARAADPGPGLDFYAPFDSAGPPPLVAFVVGRFWGVGPGERPPFERLVVRPLRSEGVAVALIGHRESGEAPHPTAARDVAAALAELVGNAAQLGFDPERVFLSGHGSGAQTAALVALDPRYLETVGLAPGRLAGLILISGLYDLATPEGVPAELTAMVERAYPSAAAREDASPLRHVSSGAPRCLALTAMRDIPGFRESALELTSGLRDAGQPEALTFVVVGRDHRSILSLGDARNAARRHILGFVGVGDAADEFQQTWAARHHWRDPARSTEGFRREPGLLQEIEADELFLAWLRRYFAASGSRAKVGGRRYQAVELDAWLESSGLGSGRWLVTENARGEQAVLDLDALRPYGPLVVVGLDDTTNLFEVVDLYRTRRRTTWKQAEEETWILARPLGGFLHFRKELPAELVPSVFGMFALTPESFRVTDEDPLASLRGLDPELRELLVREAACLSCHRFREAGARGGHLRASDGKRVGGFAEPLEEYPPEVWRRFVFEQGEVSSELGSAPIYLPEPRQRLLHDAVARERR